MLGFLCAVKEMLGGQNDCMKPKFVMVLFAFIHHYVHCPFLRKLVMFKESSINKALEDLWQRPMYISSKLISTKKPMKKGIFRFTELPEGTYTFVVNTLARNPSLDRKPSLTSAAVTPPKSKIHLGPVFKLETVIVEGRRLPPTVSRTEVRGSELLRIPGTTNDPLKGLMTLPSIGIPNDYFGILYIRGSGPGDTLYYLDRTPFGYPFHYGGLVSNNQF